MQNVLITLIDRILSWPIAALVLGLIFRTPITALINRIDLFKGPGIELSSPIIAKASTQLNAGETPKSGELLATSEAPQQLTFPGEVDPQQHLTFPDEVEREREQVKAYGGNEEVLILQMQSIENHLSRLHFSLDSQETSRVLVRQLAVIQLLYKAERAYRLLFGSQIVFMRYLNETGRQPESIARSFYERAQVENPNFYSDYPFESWIGFLTLQQSLIAVEDDMYGISLWGREFLGWMATTGVPSKLY